MITRWIFISLLCVVAACNQKQTVLKPPIEREKMVSILIDIHLLEAGQQNVSIYEKGRIYNTIVGYEKIFLKHGVTSEEFYDSFKYYRNHPKEMDELYQEVIDEVTRRESEISTEAAKDRSHQPDSTRRNPPRNPFRPKSNQ